MGLDGGSTYLKAALLKGHQIVDTAERMLGTLCGKNDILCGDIRYTMATGYSRKILTVADNDISEIAAHAYGVRIAAPEKYRPGMIIDIGEQDSKIVYLDSGYHIKNFTRKSLRTKNIGG